MESHIRKHNLKSSNVKSEPACVNEPVYLTSMLQHYDVNIKTWTLTGTLYEVAYFVNPWESTPRTSRARVGNRGLVRGCVGAVRERISMDPRECMYEQNIISFLTVTLIHKIIFQAWGWELISLDNFNDERNGFLIKDTCNVEADVTVLGTVTSLA
ncbi:hypothetical protein Scep_029847 [Stephania cephalantha]|uniref:Uncharacterized protein n=1 Tax=Stephania cephalantha TaxID=152367 RepID=A0AAP0DYN0_9MAGN